MLDSVDKMLPSVNTIEFYEMPSVYHSNTTLYGGGGKLGMDKCEKSAIRSNNFGNDCICNKGRLSTISNFFVTLSFCDIE